MMDAIAIFSFLFSLMLCSLGLGFLGGHMSGYYSGQKETERRWSEATARAEDHRRYGAPK